MKARKKSSMPIFSCWTKQYCTS